MNKKRPVNLDIGSIKLPITSYVSILHRLSGVFLFAATACILWAFDASLESQQSFQSLKECLTSPLAQAILWLISVAFAYHIIAGIRHLVMDFGVGEDSYESGRRSAWLAVAAIVIVVLLITGWVFLW